MSTTPHTNDAPQAAASAPASAPVVASAVTSAATSAATSSGARSSHVIFRLGGTQYGLSAPRIREVVNVGRTHPVPFAPPFVFGVANHRGRIFTLVDLGALLGTGPQGGERVQALLLEWGMGEVGLIVGAVDEVAFGGAELEPARGEGPYDGGTLRRGGTTVRVLDCDALLNDILERFRSGDAATERRPAAPAGR